MDYRLLQKGELTEKQFSDLMSLGKNYEKDIGGIDLGFGSMIETSKYFFLIEDNQKLVGFILGGIPIHTYWDDENVFYPKAVYLTSDYREKEGKHTGIFQNSLEGLVGSLTEQNFDRLNLFPDIPGEVTKFGHDYVLKKFHMLLCKLAENSKGSYINAGRNSKFNPVYLFKPEEFNEKQEGLRQR